MANGNSNISSAHTQKVMDILQMKSGSYSESIAEENGDEAVRSKSGQGLVFEQANYYPMNSGQGEKRGSEQMEEIRNFGESECSTKLTQSVQSDRNNMLYISFENKEMFENAIRKSQ